MKIFIFFGLLSVLLGCSGSLPSSIGNFAPCPKSPNCVSTKSSDQEHWIKAIYYKMQKEKAKEILLDIVKKMPGTYVKVNQYNFLHIEFTSSLFGFVDDVEFYFEEEGVINFKSASRLGYSDLGVNRKRMENIGKKFSLIPTVK